MEHTNSIASGHELCGNLSSKIHRDRIHYEVVGKLIIVIPLYQIVRNSIEKSIVLVDPKLIHGRGVHSLPEEEGSLPKMRMR